MDGCLFLNQCNTVMCLTTQHQQQVKNNNLNTTHKHTYTHSLSHSHTHTHTHTQRTCISLPQQWDLRSVCKQPQPQQTLTKERRTPCTHLQRLTQSHSAVTDSLYSPAITTPPPHGGKHPQHRQPDSQSGTIPTAFFLSFSSSS